MGSLSSSGVKHHLAQEGGGDGLRVLEGCEANLKMEYEVRKYWKIKPLWGHPGKSLGAPAWAPGCKAEHFIVKIALKPNIVKTTCLHIFCGCRSQTSSGESIAMATVLLWQTWQHWMAKFYNCFQDNVTGSWGPGRFLTRTVCCIFQATMQMSSSTDSRGMIQLPHSTCTMLQLSGGQD